MKKFFILLFIIISCSSDSSDAEIIVTDPDPDPDQTEESFKKIVSDNYNSDFKFGATLNYFQLNSNVEELFLKEFNYTTPENSFKQTIVHPEPGVWNWSRVEAFLDFAYLTLRRTNACLSSLHNRWLLQEGLLEFHQ